MDGILIGVVIFLIVQTPVAELLNIGILVFVISFLNSRMYIYSKEVTCVSKILQ